MIFAWLLTLKNPYTNMDPTLFFQKYKQQYWDKLNEVKTPWKLVGASKSSHSMIEYLLRQPTKSNNLWFVLDRWPLKGHWTTSTSSPHFFQKKMKFLYHQKHMHVKWLHAKFHLQLQFSNENMRILLSAAIFKSRLQYIQNTAAYGTLWRWCCSQNAS